MFGGHPLGRPIIGRAPVIRDTPVEDIAAFHAARYVPGSVVIAAAGSVDHDQIVELAEKTLRDGVGSAPGIEPAPADPSPTVRFQRKDTEQCHVCLGAIGLPRGDERPHHFDLVINPYDLDAGVYVTTMYRRPFRPDYPRPPQGDLAPGDDALQVVGAVTDVLPGLIPAVVTAAVRAQYRTTAAPIEGTQGEIFPTTTTRGRASGSSIGVPIEHALDVMELVLGINRDHGPFPCLVALRFVPRTRARLGFTRFERTCIVDVDGTLSNRTRSFYSRIWQALSTSGIPYTMHWGKLLGLSAAEARRLYGGDVDRWLAARRALLDPPLRRAFSNRFLEELDLAT